MRITEADLLSLCGELPAAARTGMRLDEWLDKTHLFILPVLFSVIFPRAVFCEEQLAADKKQPPVFAGSFFDTQVPIENYHFVKGVIAVFGNKFGPQPNAPEDLENVAWEQLILSYEAFRRGITVSDEEVGEEVGKILAEEKAAFDWKADKDAYEKWVKEKANISSVFFENMIRHLLQVEKLRRQITAAIEPAVSIDEAFQEFLNEHNSLSVELVEFGDEIEAGKFYKKAKSNPKYWDEEKNKRPGGFKLPGFVSLEFLINIWGFSRESAYKMMQMNKGGLYPPAPIYKGYAVFKVLDKRPADKREFKKFKTSYFEQIRRRKKYEGLGKWFEDFKKQADIKAYKEG